MSAIPITLLWYQRIGEEIVFYLDRKTSPCTAVDLPFFHAVLGHIGVWSFRYKVVSIQIVSMQIEVVSIPYVKSFRYTSKVDSVQTEVNLIQTVSRFVGPRSKSKLNFL